MNKNTSAEMRARNRAEKRGIQPDTEAEMERKNEERRVMREVCR